MSNMHQLQKFGRSFALVSAQHAEELMSLATSPPRSQQATSAQLDQMAAVYGVDTMRGKPFLFAGGIAVIPVWGALLHRDAWCDSYATGYDYIAAAVGAAVGDEDVKGIVYDLNSYGGHVSGNFELCDLIFDARAKKPAVAIVDSRALSGGYSIASAVGRIIATPSADIGSVGVVLMHMSQEKMMENIGLKVTMIHAGKHKVDGNPYENLSEDVIAALQASVDKSYEQFVSLVARNRGIDPQSVRETEARVYAADDAKALGLIDDVMPPRAAFASFLSELSSSPQTKEAKKMTDTTAPKVDGGDDNARAIAEATTAAKKAEQTRITGILASDEAKTRPALASHLITTEMSVDDARKLMAAAAEEKKDAPAPAAPVASANLLSDAMRASGGGSGVEAGGDGDDADADKPRMSAGQRIAAVRDKMQGRKPVTH